MGPFAKYLCTKRLRRLTAVFAALCFSTTSVSAQPALVSPVSNPQAMILVPGALKIPENLGRVESFHNAGEGKPFVFFIQDAHAIVDAQTSIRNLIGLFEKDYGVKLVGVEGGEGKLDPLVFRAFPDAFVKEKVMHGYLQQGEITGSGLAAIFGPRTSSYFGIENWELYKQNYVAYLKTTLEREKTLKTLSKVRDGLNMQAKAVFTPELQEFHNQSERFYTERSHLLEFLKYLASAAPETKGEEKEETAKKYPHLAAMFDSISRERGAPSVNLDAAIRRMAKSFQEHYADKLDRKTQMEFNGMHQKFVSGQVDGGKFLRYLVETGKAAGLSPRLSPEMRELIGHTEKLSQIKGTRLFEELEAFAAERERALTQNEMQARLSEDFRRFRLLGDLVRLELSREQLEIYQKDAEGHLSLLPDEARELLNPALDFYRIALERDQVFHEKIERLMKSEKASSAIVLAGGFHAKGFERELQDKGYSYAVITPAIDSLEGQSVYQSVMTGKLSYAKDLEKSFYDAFVRHSTAALVRDLNEPDFRRTVKLWRDEIIRMLASEGRTVEAGAYTRSLDQLVRIYNKKFGGNPKSKTLPEILDETDRVMQDFKKETLEGLWTKFQSGMNDFFVTHKSGSSAAPSPQSVLSPALGNLIRSELRPEDPVLVAATQGVLRALQMARESEVSSPRTPFTALSSPQIAKVLGDLKASQPTDVVFQSAVLELRNELRLAAQAGDRLGLEGQTNSVEFARTLNDRVEAIVQTLPPGERVNARGQILGLLEKDYPQSALQGPAAIEALPQPAAPTVEAARAELRAETVGPEGDRGVYRYSADPAGGDRVFTRPADQTEIKIGVGSFGLFSAEEYKKMQRLRTDCADTCTAIGMRAVRAEEPFLGLGHVFIQGGGQVQYSLREHVKAILDRLLTQGGFQASDFKDLVISYRDGSYKDKRTGEAPFYQSAQVISPEALEQEFRNDPFFKDMNVTFHRRGVSSEESFVVDMEVSRTGVEVFPSYTKGPDRKVLQTVPWSNRAELRSTERTQDDELEYVEEIPAVDPAAVQAYLNLKTPEPSPLGGGVFYIADYNLNKARLAAREGNFTEALRMYKFTLESAFDYRKNGAPAAHLAAVEARIQELEDVLAQRTAQIEGLKAGEELVMEIDDDGWVSLDEDIEAPASLEEVSGISQKLSPAARALQQALKAVLDNPRSEDAWRAVTDALSLRGAEGLTEEQALSLIQAFTSLDFEALSEDIRPRVDPTISAETAELSKMLISQEKILRRQSLQEKQLRTIAKQLSMAITSGLKTEVLAGVLGQWAGRHVQEAAAGGKISMPEGMPELQARFSEMPSFAALLSDTQKSKALFEVLSVLRLILTFEKTEANNFDIPLNDTLFLRVDTGSYRRFILAERSASGETHALEIKIPGEQQHKLEVSRKDYEVSEEFEKIPELQGRYQKALGIVEYPAIVYSLYGMKVDFAKEGYPFNVIFSDYSIADHQQRSRLSDYLAANTGRVSEAEALEISKQISELTFQGVMANGWAGGRDMVHFQNFTIVKNQGQLQISLVNDFDAFRRIASQADVEANQYTFGQFLKQASAINASSSEEVKALLRQSYGAAKELLQAQGVLNGVGEFAARSELRMAEDPLAEPVTHPIPLEEWLPRYYQYPSLNLGDRLERTKDYVRMDGVFYVQQGANLQASIAAAKQEIANRGQNEKIVVLTEAKQYGGALTFKHHFHTALSLALLSQVSAAVRGETLIDLGAGSGILGVTALLRDGASSVLAVDMDAEALATAQESLRLTEEANGLEPGSLSSKFRSFPTTFADFGKQITADNFNLLRTQVSAHPVIITNNPQPWSIPDLINKELGAWINASAASYIGLPAPSHIAIAGSSYDEDSHRHEMASKDAYRDGLPKGWLIQPVVIEDFHGEVTSYLGVLYQSPNYAAAPRSELRSENADALSSLQQKMAVQVKDQESILPVKGLSLSESEREALAKVIAQLDHEAFGGKGQVPESKVDQVLGAIQRGETYYVLFDKSGELKGYLHSKVNDTNHTAYLERLAARPGAGRGTSLLNRYFRDLAAIGVTSVSWTADGFSAGFYIPYLTGKMAYNALSAASSFEVDLTSYDFNKSETRITDKTILKLQQDYLERVKQREGEARAAVERLSQSAGNYVLSVTVVGEKLELPASVDAQGVWFVAMFPPTDEKGAKSGLLRVLMYNGAAELLQNGTPAVEASGIQDLRTFEREEDLPFAEEIRSELRSEAAQDPLVRLSEIAKKAGFKSVVMMNSAVNLANNPVTGADSRDEAWVAKMLGEVTTGADIEGVSSAKRTIMRGKIPIWVIEIVYRDKELKPVAMARLTHNLLDQWHIHTIAADRSRGALAGRAVYAVGLEAMKEISDLSLGSGQLSPEGAAFMNKAVKLMFKNLSDEERDLIGLKKDAARSELRQQSDTWDEMSDEEFSSMFADLDFDIKPLNEQRRILKRAAEEIRDKTGILFMGHGVGAEGKTRGGLISTRYIIQSNGIQHSKGYEFYGALTELNVQGESSAANMSPHDSGGMGMFIPFPEKIYHYEEDEEGKFRPMRDIMLIVVNKEFIPDLYGYVNGLIQEARSDPSRKTEAETLESTLRKIVSYEDAAEFLKEKYLKPRGVMGYFLPEGEIPEDLPMAIPLDEDEQDPNADVVTPRYYTAEEVAGLPKAIPLEEDSDTSVVTLTYVTDEEAAGLPLAIPISEHPESLEDDRKGDTARSELRSTSELPFDFETSDPQAFVKGVLAKSGNIFNALFKYEKVTSKIGRRDLGTDGVSAVVERTDQRPTVYIGDLHGRVDVFLAILHDTIQLKEGKMTVLEALKQGLINLTQVGDLIHPASDYENEEAHLQSFALFVAFLALKNAMPDQIAFTVGNHESSILPEDENNVIRKNKADERINLDEVLKKAIRNKAGDAAGWNPLVLNDKGVKTRYVKEEVGQLLFDMYVDAVRATPVVIKQKSGNSAIGVVHAGPPANDSQISREELERVTSDRRAATPYRDLLWTREAESSGEQAREHLKNFSKIQGLSLLIHGHTPIPNFRKSTAMTVYTDGSAAVFGIMSTDEGQHQIVIDAAYAKEKVGYLLIDPSAGVPADPAQLKAPQGQSAFRVLDLTKQEPSKAFTPSTANAAAKPAPKIPGAGKISKPAGEYRDTRVFNGGDFYFKIAIEDEWVIVYETKPTGEIIGELKRQYIEDGKIATLGRGGSDFVIPGKKYVHASRLQATIVRRGDKYFLSDQGLSLNGTYADGQKIQHEELRFTEKIDNSAKPSVKQTVYATGTNFTAVPLDAQGLVDVEKLLVPSQMPSAAELVEEIRNYILVYVKDPVKQAHALKNLTDPVIAPLLLPYMMEARKSNILLVVSQDAYGKAGFDMILKPQLDILKKVFNSLPKELLWEMTAPQGYELTETGDQVAGFQITENTMAGGGIGEVKTEEDARRTTIHEILGHKRHNTKALKFELSADGSQVRRLEGPDAWNMIVDGKTWLKIGELNGETTLIPFTDELKESMEKGYSISFSNESLKISRIAEMSDQEVLYLMRNLYVHAFGYHNDLREILAFSISGDNLSKPYGKKNEIRNARLKYEETRRLLLESAGRVVSIPVDPANQVYRAYIFDPFTAKFDKVYLQKIGDEFLKVERNGQVWKLLEQPSKTPVVQLKPAVQPVKAVTAPTPVQVSTPVHNASAPVEISKEVIAIGHGLFQVQKEGQSISVVSVDRAAQSKSVAVKGILVFKIGRDPRGNDLVLNDTNVSAYHAQIRLGDDGVYRVVDQGSRNGIREQGGERVNSIVLNFEPVPMAAPVEEDNAGTFEIPDLTPQLDSDEAERAQAFFEEQAEKERAARAAWSPEELMRQDRGAEWVLERLFSEGTIIRAARGVQVDFAKLLTLSDLSGLSVSDEHLPPAMKPYFSAALDLFAASGNSADGARERAVVLANALRLADFLTSLTQAKNSIKAGMFISLLNAQERNKTLGSSKETETFFRTVLQQGLKSEYWYAGLANAKISPIVDRLFNSARAELRSSEDSSSAVPGEARIYLSQSDLEKLASVAQGIGQSIESLRAEVMAKAESQQAEINQAFTAFLVDVSGLLRQAQTTDDLLDFIFKGDFNTQMAAAMGKNTGALNAPAQEALAAASEQLSERIRKSIVASVLASEISATVVSSAAMSRLSVQARALLESRNAAVLEDAYKELRTLGTFSLPAGNFLSAAAPSKEAWFLSSAYLNASEDRAKTAMQKQIKEFFEGKGASLTVGYTVGTPEERVALDIAKMLTAALAVGRRFGESLRAGKLGYEIQSAESPVFVLSAAEGTIQRSPRDNLDKAKGLVGSEQFLSPEALSHKDYLLLADLVVHSPYLYGQLKEKEGFAFGVMDEEVLNSFIGFLNALAETKAAEAVVRASA